MTDKPLDQKYLDGETAIDIATREVKTIVMSTLGQITLPDDPLEVPWGSTQFCRTYIEETKTGPVKGHHISWYVKKTRRSVYVECIVHVQYPVRPHLETSISDPISALWADANGRFKLNYRFALPVRKTMEQYLVGLHLRLPLIFQRWQPILGAGE